MKNKDKDMITRAGFSDALSYAFKVPQDKSHRESIRHRVQHAVTQENLIPPLSLEELSHHADTIIQQDRIPAGYKDFVTVLVGNAVWKDTMATVPYEKRVLLLPQCLRDKASCPAQMDAFGLLCEECGRCPTGDLQALAEDLGTVVLVAEGTTVVTKLLESGQVEAVIGVGCLSALERSFPYLTAAAIPGVAIPLYKDGCDRTAVDVDWIRDAVLIKSNRPWEIRLNLDRLRDEVMTWFQEDVLSPILMRNQTVTERIALEWMAAGGKRWRPFLATSIYQAIQGANHPIPETMKHLAVAVECFHKASLVHDDIEDDDSYRYGKPTLHIENGMPVALNIGDLLVGEGYRLIAECGAEAHRIARMLSAASQGHRNLCLGQGEELHWKANPDMLSTEKVLEIFQRKTSPAFDVALSLGALCAGANGGLCQILKCFSDSLGIAYQIRDDIEDFTGDGIDSDFRVLRPSLLLALAVENANGRKELLNRLIHRERLQADSETIRKIISDMELEQRAWQIFEEYKNEAIRALRPLKNSRLKSLLFRLVYKILGGVSEKTEFHQPRILPSSTPERIRESVE